MPIDRLTRHLLLDQVVGKDIAAVASSHNHTQSQITDLEHDATEIRSVTVANSGPGDNMLLTFDNALGQWVPEAGTGHAHIQSNITDLSHDATKIQSVAVGTGAPADNNVLTFDSGAGAWGPEAGTGHTHLQANVTDLVHDATKIQSVAVGTGAPSADNLLTFDDVSGTWRPEAASGHNHDLTYSTLVHSHLADGVPTFVGTFSSLVHSHVAGDIPTFVNTFAVKNFADGIAFGFGTGTSVVSVGETLLIPIPFACTIQNFITVADTAGTVNINILKTSANSMPHGAGDSIVASVPPTLTNSVVNVNATLTGWTTAIAANDVLKASMTSCDSANLVTVTLGVVRA